MKHITIALPNFITWKISLPVKVRAPSDGVVSVVLQSLLIAIILRRIRPKQVTHWPKGWRFFKPV